MSSEATAYGLPMPPLGDGCIPLEVVAVVKCLDADGNTMLAMRNTGGVTLWEGAGMLQTARLDNERDLLAATTPSQGDE